MLDDDDAEDDKEHPLWGRIFLAVVIAASGAGLGGAIGESWMAAFWGAVIASPIAWLGFVAPGAFAWILVVLQLFSCAS
jgi:hypothetical protein